MTTYIIYHDYMIIVTIEDVRHFLSFLVLSEAKQISNLDT